MLSVFYPYRSRMYQRDFFLFCDRRKFVVEYCSQAIVFIKFQFWLLLLCDHPPLVMNKHLQCIPQFLDSSVVVEGASHLQDYLDHRLLHRHVHLICGPISAINSHAMWTNSEQTGISDSESNNSDTLQVFSGLCMWWISFAAFHKHRHHFCLNRSHQCHWKITSSRD